MNIWRYVAVIGDQLADGRMARPARVRIFKPIRILGICILVLLTGCASTPNVKQINRLQAADETSRVLVMTPDVKYYLITAGGVPQPQAEWTKAARRNFADSLQAFAHEHGVTIIMLEEGHQLTELEVSYQKLYSAVGSSILVHHFGTWKLPAKQGAFDWSLGPGVQGLAKEYGADYALFSYYRDYQASAGRSALALLAAVAGVGISAGGEGGFASLVDLRTGDIVWFNQISGDHGELREKDNARKTIDALFEDLPDA